MEPIEEIPNITIQQIGARTWLYQIPVIPNNDPPVTLQLGFPIVELLVVLSHIKIIKLIHQITFR